MADLTDIEIARVGSWTLASGPLDVTEQMLRDAADYAARSDARPAPIKIGHGDPRFDGEPAMGWLTNLRVDGAGDSAVLKGDVTGMPDWLVRAAPSAWPDRSMEGWTDFEVGGRTYSLVVDGLALLGVTPPGMATIRSLRDLPQALGVAASSRIAAAKLVPPIVGEVGSTGDSTGPHLRVEIPETPVTAAEAAARIHNAPLRGSQKGATVDFTTEQESTLRALAGIADGEPLEPDKVLASLSERLQPKQEPEAEADKPNSEPEKKVAAMTKVTTGTMVIDADAWEAQQERIRRIEAAEAQRRRDERDAVIASAIKEGKFLPGRAEHWKRLWDADPEGTRQVIDGLTRNVVPVLAMGYAGGPDDDGIDEEFAHLFPPTTTSKGR